MCPALRRHTVKKTVPTNLSRLLRDPIYILLQYSYTWYKKVYFGIFW